MHVLVAVDGSTGSEQAARLVQALRWPSGTSVTLLGIVDPGAWIPPGPGVPGRGGLVREGEVSAYLQGHHLAIAERLERARLSVNSSIVEGRPADSIVEEVKRIDADLVVLGSRGHGRIASLLLGSVSAAVVDRSPSSVLVARDERLTGVLLAIDGSRSARSAARIAATWPPFEDVPMTVVTVADAIRPWTSGISPAFLGRARRRRHHLERTAVSEAHEIADEAIAGLERAGRTATADVRQGEIAAEIIDAAREHGADMVVMGCRGRTSLRSILLGSVARDVVLASDSSVMVVRAHPDKKAGA
jgi:nucleotide-binding universal stress UspA family protein